MTNQHRARPEVWAKLGKWARSQTTGSCILELRARVEALEAQYACISRPGSYYDGPMASPLVVRTREMKDGIRDGLLTLEEALKAEEEWIRGAPFPARARVEAPEARPAAAPAPTDSLVERVADAIAAEATSAGIVNDRPARAAIREVAAWLSEGRGDSGAWCTAAADLIKEVNR